MSNKSSYVIPAPFNAYRFSVEDVHDSFFTDFDVHFPPLSLDDVSTVSALRLNLCEVANAIDFNESPLLTNIMKSLPLIILFISLSCLIFIVF